MALRPRLSAGLPLSNKHGKVQKKEPGLWGQAREDTSNDLFFGNLAVVIT